MRAQLILKGVSSSSKQIDKAKETTLERADI